MEVKASEEKTRERERLVYSARLAEQAERYQEMVDLMKTVARLDLELTPEERHLLSVAYKNLIGARRASWRILSSVQHKEEAKGSQRCVELIGQYRKRVEEELVKICNDILSIIAIHLLPSSAAGESIVFFYKMKGDYYRYLAEFKSENERKEAADQSLKAYQAATSTAMTELSPIHPVRLGLALNFSVFYYEILSSPERACQLAKQAFDAAITEIGNVDEEESYKDSTLILQLLKDNLTLWTADLTEESGAQTKNDAVDMEVSHDLDLFEALLFCHRHQLSTFPFDLKMHKHKNIDCFKLLAQFRNGIITCGCMQFKEIFPTFTELIATEMV